MQGVEAGIRSVIEGGSAAGVEHSAELVAFSEAAVVGTDEQMAEARENLVAVMGEAAMVDAAGVTSNFQRMVRIADSTGIVLGDRMEDFSEEVRSELGLERLRAAKLAAG